MRTVVAVLPEEVTAQDFSRLVSSCGGEIIDETPPKTASIQDGAGAVLLYYDSEPMCADADETETVSSRLGSPIGATIEVQITNLASSDKTAKKVIDEILS